MKNADDWSSGLAWSAEFDVDDETINQQHKYVFKLTSDLIEACEKGEGQDFLEKAFDFVAGYTTEHFEYEESLMDKHNLPDNERHKKLHSDFTLTMIELKKNYEKSGASDSLSRELNRTVIRWLINHIIREDTKTFKSLENQMNPTA